MSHIIHQVRLVNPEAADWLSANRELLNDGDPNTLSALMTWSETPQGHNYWRNIANQLTNGKQNTTECEHPFNIRDDSSVSYQGHSFTEYNIKHMIQLYRAKNPDIGYSAGHKMSFIPSHIKIGCQEFSIAEIEAFIKEYEEFEENTHIAIGDYVFIDSVHYIVASVSMDEATLISLENGARWCNAKNAPNKKKIPIDIFFRNKDEHVIKVEKRS